MTWPVSVVALLQDLIRIPSVNPEGDPGCKETGESLIASYVGDLLEELGASVTFQEALPGRPNVLARFPSSGDIQKHRLLFAPHLDTVSVSGMTIPPFGGEVYEGCVWGRGATDTKGSMAAMLWALYQARERIPHLPWEIWFAGLVDEETYQAGSRKLAAETRFDFVVVGEPTSMHVVHRTKGSLRLTLRTRGRAAHGSSPEVGENAIFKMLDVLHWVREVATPQLHQNVSPDLGSSSINVGIIQGGVRHNIVPDLCEAVLDIRTVLGQNVGALKESLHRIYPDLEIETRVAPPLYTRPDHPLIQKLLTIGSQLSMGSQLATAPWFCDATSFSAAGIPAIAIGPGSIAQAHTTNEFLKISDLEQGGLFFESFLNNLVG